MYVLVFDYVLIYLGRYFLWDEEIGEAALFHSRPEGNASFLPREESWQQALGLWDLCGIRALSELKLDVSSV